jgi:hypothetical protein
MMVYKQIKVKARNLDEAYEKAHEKIQGTYNLLQKYVILIKPTKNKLGLYLILADRGY